MTGLSGLFHFSCRDAGGTDRDAPGLAVDDATNFVNVRVESSVGDIMGMADFMTELGAFPAYFAFPGHDQSP